MSLGRVPGDVSVHADMDRIIVATPGPPGSAGHWRAPPLPWVVGVAVVVASTAMVRSVAFGASVAAFGGMLLLILGASATPVERRVRLRVDAVRLHVEPADAPAVELLLADIGHVRAAGWTVLVEGPEGAALLALGVSSREAAAWIAALLDQRVKAPGDVPPELEALRRGLSSREV